MAEFVPGTGPIISTEELAGTINGLVAWLSGMSDKDENVSLAFTPSEGPRAGEEIVFIPNAARAARVLHTYAITRGIG